MFKSALLAFALFSTPVLAAPAFEADPTAKPAAERIVLRDTIWRCGDAGCAAGKSSSRPAVVCAVFAKKVGSLRSFSAEGQALSPEELEKCNARSAQ